MCEKCEQQESEVNKINTPESDSSESQENELTSLLDNLVVEDVPININELLETEMVTTRTLYLNDDVTDESIGHIIMMIHKFNRDDEGLDKDQRVPVILYINTGGGGLYNAFNLVGAIESSETPIVGIVEGGICMSAGIPIFLACHHRGISRHSTFMYHDLRVTGADGHTSTLAEMKNTYAHYEHLQNRIDEYIAERTTIPIKKLRKKRKKNVDWYLSLSELEKYGFYHSLI